MRAHDAVRAIFAFCTTTIRHLFAINIIHGACIRWLDYTVYRLAERNAWPSAGGVVVTQDQYPAHRSIAQELAETYSHCLCTPVQQDLQSPKARILEPNNAEQFDALLSTGLLRQDRLAP